MMICGRNRLRFAPGLIHPRTAALKDYHRGIYTGRLSGVSSNRKTPPWLAKGVFDILRIHGDLGRDRTPPLMVTSVGIEPTSAA